MKTSILDTAREVFSSDRYATEITGIEITEVGDHTASCRLATDSRHRNARGVAMGGVLFTLADFCSAVAANSDTLDELHWVSLDSSIHFLSPATGDCLTATTAPIKRGRTTALFQTVVSCDGKQTAVIMTTMMHVN